MEKEKLDIKKLQADHHTWMIHNFGYDVDSYRTLLGAMEELGELAHAHLKEVDKIRGTQPELRAAARDAVGDIVLFLSGYCSLRGFDLEDCISKAWDEVKTRDWKKNPIDGGASTLSNRQKGMWCQNDPTKSS